jgi:uncharacterized protein YdhG (YjbR/CyaY superfamily)
MKKERNDNSPWKGIEAKDIDEYLAAVPEDIRETLQDLRNVIRSAAPDAKEAIYYRIPTFILNGPLVGFSASQNHCGLHLMSPPLMAAHKDELKGFGTTTATIHFPIGKPLPAALITKLVKERAIENEKRARKA